MYLGSQQRKKRSKFEAEFFEVDFRPKEYGGVIPMKDDGMKDKALISCSSLQCVPVHRCCRMFLLRGDERSDFRCAAIWSGCEEHDYC